MSKMRHAQLLDTVTRWIGRTIYGFDQGARAHVDPVHLKTWHDALVSLRDDIARRETAIITAESLIEDEAAGQLVDQLTAEHAFRLVTKSIEQLAGLARDGAARELYPDIDKTACLILDALETLARGIVRPAGHHTHTEDKGA